MGKRRNSRAFNLMIGLGTLSILFVFCLYEFSPELRDRAKEVFYRIFFGRAPAVATF